MTASPSLAPVLVLMGVSGSGKSTVAALLAGRLGWDFEEGDDLHPAANIAKMAAGHPLDDADRAPWLAKVAAWIREHTEAGKPGIITCSALERRYRNVLRGDDVTFVYLAGTEAEIAQRLAARHGHFMPPALLHSQFAILEPPAADERAITVNISASSSELASQIIELLHLQDEADPA
ncbi:gluconokinase [Jatrophihabitans sp.]|uniref:gluconokinase n=1 Tax=Jatrophihabitans sp. TaxID=1932789 RepID=UPI0030C6CDE8|nr:gluconokinase [Jatrophihabitans sp.]